MAADAPSDLTVDDSGADSVLAAMLSLLSCFPADINRAVGKGREGKGRGGKAR